jgi:elongation factor G
VETAAIVINAATGIEPMAVRMMEWARQRERDRIIIVNKIDAQGVNLQALMQQIQSEFGRECLPVNLPAQDGKSVVDCFFKPSGVADFSTVAEAHQRIIDQVVEINETVMDHFLEQGEEGLSGQELHDAFEQCLREGHLVPVCFVSARTGAGVKELLDFFEKLLPDLPSNRRLPRRRAKRQAHRRDLRQTRAAHVFRSPGPPVGKMGVIRVREGTITRDSQLYVGDGRRPFKVSPLLLQGRS